jgi:hypothetical protein
MGRLQIGQWPGRANRIACQISVTVPTVERFREVVFWSIEIAGPGRRSSRRPLLHHLEELARVRGEFLHVAALALGVVLNARLDFPEPERPVM